MDEVRKVRMYEIFISKQSSFTIYKSKIIPKDLKQDVNTFTYKLNLYPIILSFDNPNKKAFENIVRKGENAVFYPIKNKLHNMSHI